MKELSIEQKAQRYDEAVGVCRKLYNKAKANGYTSLSEAYEKIFPALKESEDEKIRKDIVEAVEFHKDFSQKRKEYIYAWLEKQGEQKPVDKVEHLIPQKGMYYTCIKDYYSSDNTHLCVKGHIYKSFFNGYIDDESHLGLSWTNSCTEKYFEPTKDEDWIVCEHDNVIGEPMQYKEFKKKVNQKFIKNLKAKGLTPKLRLWNLQDVKDGDILYAKGSYFKEYLFMFSSFTEDNVISTYFGYDVFHGTFDKKLTRFGREEDFMSVIPATKEQRDILFQKMKEAGYEWDAEKKDLKKIEQIMPKFKVGDKVYALRNRFECTIESIDGTTYYGDTTNFDIKDQDDWELVEQETIWSKEDERIYQSIMDDTVQENQLNDEQTNWLKDIKYRYFPQPKPAWSEEDESWFEEMELMCLNFSNDTDYRDKFSTWLKSLKDRIRPKVELTQLDKNILEAAIAFVEQNNHFNYWRGVDKHTVLSALHSLRPQNRWKPSEEQLKSLQKVIDAGYFTSYPNSIETLYEQLKQL